MMMKKRSTMMMKRMSIIKMKTITTNRRTPWLYCKN